MPRIPDRESLPAQAARILREMISSGELQGLLPGERTLAAQLQIGRDTLRAALALLEKNGVISPNEHGKRRRILASPAKSRKSTKRIAFLSPKPLSELPPWMLVEFDSLREFLNQRDYTLQLLSPGLFRLKNPRGKLESLVRETDADAWILYQCSPQIQQWFHERTIPALIRGYPHPGVEIPSIDEDWEAAAFHAGTLLKRHRHHRIGLLMPDSKLAGLLATERGLRKAFDSAESVITLIEKGTSESVTHSLARALRLEDPPTAIVATRSRHVLSLISWIAQFKMSVPRDLSLVVIASEPWFEHLFPKPCHYAADPANFARTVVRLIVPIANGKQAAATKRLLIPDYVAGGTIASIEIGSK